MIHNTSDNRISDMNMAANVYACIYGISSEEALTRLSSEYHNTSMAAMLEDIAMKERDYYLNMHKYKITSPNPEGDTRYRTYLNSQDGKKQLVARKNLRTLKML